MESLNEVISLLNFDILSLLDEVFKQSDVKKTMIEFNQDQLQEGKDALGQIITTIGGSPYRLYTIHIKKKKGQPTNKVTLYDTGEFYKTFKVKINSNSYEIIADFDKQDGSILDNFSSKFDFLGLDDESLNELAFEVIYPKLSAILRKKLGI